jgi:hypothetical protein
MEKARKFLIKFRPLKGQLNIEFIGGFLLFISAIFFVSFSATGIFSEFEKQNRINDLGSSMIAISNILLNSEGYWQNENLGGTDWDKNLNFTKSLGLLDQGKFSDSKFDALNKLGYERVRELLSTDKNFLIESSSFYYIETREKFDKPFKPPFIIEPSDTFYTNFNTSINYGSGTINGQKMYFLVLLNRTAFRIYASKSWNFSSAEIIQPGNMNLTINGEPFSLIQNSVVISKGNILIFKSKEKRFGIPPGFGARNVLSSDRFSISDSVGTRIVKLSLVVWRL